MIEFVPFTADRKEEIFKLLENQPIKRVLWDWQYNDNPWSANSSAGMVLLVDGKVAGFKGTMNVRLKMGSSVVDSIWNNDTYIHRDFRGKGFGGKLIEIIESMVPVALAFGISDMQLPIFLKRGWKKNVEVQEYFFQNKIASTRDLLKVLIQSPSFFNKKIRSIAYSIKDVPARDIPQEADLVWKKVHVEYNKIVVRNYDYLKWKYSDHPSQSYRALVAYEGNNLLAIAIYRHTDSIARFVDYLGPAHNQGLKQQILESFIVACKNSAKLHVITTDKEFINSLNCFGFRKYGIGPSFCIYTNPPAAQCEEGWFLMMGDSDGDLIDAMKDSVAITRIN